jgi:NADPH-dependent 2,4-dienoyl-CoA reductase/sulfur reductase-like enzyme
VHIERALKATLRSGTQVRGVDLEQRAVLLDGGESVPYETLVLGTGGSEWCMRIAVEWC